MTFGGQRALDEGEREHSTRRGPRPCRPERVRQINTHQDPRRLPSPRSGRRAGDRRSPDQAAGPHRIRLGARLELRPPGSRPPADSHGGRELPRLDDYRPSSSG